MDSVGSLVSQAQPLLELPERWHEGRATIAGQASPPPLADARLGGAPSAPFSLGRDVPRRPAPLAPPSAALLTLAAPPLAPPPPIGLPSAPAAAPPATLGATAAPIPAPSPAVAAQRRANRLHRRRYVLADPFGIRRKTRTKRRNGAIALPGRLADLILSRRTLARVTHRLGSRDVGWHWFRSAFAGPIKRRDRQEYEAWVQGGMAPMPSLVLTGMLAHTMVWTSRGRRARLIEGLGLLNPQEITQLAQTLFAQPNKARAIRRTYMVQERLELYQGGDSFATYLRFARHFCHTHTSLPQTAKARGDVMATTIQLAPGPVALGDAWQAHGRTLHFTAAGTTMGLKLRKDAVDATALEREDVMDQCFAKWKPELGLLGSFPRSHGLLLFAPDAQVRAAVAAQAAAHGAPQFDIGTAALMPALLYETPAEYHIHLHEVPTLQGLRDASHKALHDAGMLAGRMGLVHMSPADFYHNREKDRRWYWNVDQVKKAVFGRVGTGRLDRVDAGVRYYNAGPSGLRDLKHFAFFDDVKNEYGDNGPLALTSTMGDFLLAWTLSVCKWFNDHEALDMGLDFQSVLQDGFVTYFTAFTQQEGLRVAKFLQDVVDWPLLTRQIQYYSSRAYVQDVTQGRVPSHMLNRGATAQVRLPDEGWDPQHGWMLDGKSRDLGPKNGPFPLTELVAALYITTSFAVALRKP